MTEERGTCRHHMRTKCPICKDDEPTWDWKNHSLYCKCGQCILDTSNLTDVRDMLDKWDELTEKVANTDEEGSEYKIDDSDDVHEVMKRILPRIASIKVGTIHLDSDDDDKEDGGPWVLAQYRYEDNPDEICMQNIYQRRFRSKDGKVEYLMCLLNGIECKGYIDCTICSMPMVHQEDARKVNHCIFSKLHKNDIREGKEE